MYQTITMQQLRHSIKNCISCSMPCMLDLIKGQGPTATMLLCRTNPYYDDDKPKCNKQLKYLVKLCKDLYTYRHKHILNSLYSNAADIHFSLPMLQHTSSLKHCWLPWLINSLGSLEVWPFAMQSI